MVATQVQLTEQQASMLRALASSRGVSVDEVIRDGLDAYLTSSQVIDAAERRRRALAVAGKYRSDVNDLGTEHDRYLAEAYRQ